MANTSGKAVSPSRRGAAVRSATADDSSQFDVVLAAFGKNKMGVVKEIRAITGLGLGEARALVEAAPKTIKERVGKVEAKAIATKLREVGATVGETYVGTSKTLRSKHSALHKVPPERHVDWSDATAILGGEGALGRAPSTALEVHEMLRQGLPAKALHRMVDSLQILDVSLLITKPLGMSLRTLQRSREAPQKKLPTDQSNRVWQTAEVLAAAMRVFGDQEEVELWLVEPALGLDDQRPIDLMETAAGTDLVTGFLQRLEYGVYT